MPTNHNLMCICCSLLPVDFTHIFQGYFTDTGASSACEVLPKDMGKWIIWIENGLIP